MRIMKKYYVILTGSKNNAGDYLIKYRAKEILKSNRPDRDIIDINGWEKFDNETLDLVNKSEALILMGGPALQKNMYPGIYPLVDDLSMIKTKIVLMGVGWKSLNGSWEDTVNYSFSDSTRSLLERINDDCLSSVRDYHSLNALHSNGFYNVLMTGCPATYVEAEMSNNLIRELELSKVGFSLGVSFLESKEMKVQMQKSIISLRDYFCKSNPNSQFIVAFHHSTEKKFLDTHNSTKSHLNGHLQFISWLEENNISWKDISGSAENLIDFYSECDFHVGYRVHAHIFMSSINKPSILIAEDGRGKALPAVFGGLVLDAFTKVNNSTLHKVIRRLKLSSGFKVTGLESNDLITSVHYEIENNWPRVRKVRSNINDNYEVMKSFLKELP